ncbi:MAG: PHP domain-containing protein [Oscillospiraceae bacterium]|nr:PHP domain-containing protein [Oscillospiraceae bacterium]
MDMKICDLHTHSNYSDGTATPAQLIWQAERAGLSAVALCDHNTVAGLPEFLTAGQGSTVEAVPGIEFSTDYDGTELHLIMLFVKPQDHGAIESLLEEFRALKEQSNLALIRALKDSGYQIDYASLRQQAPGGYINRAHIAAELTRLGYTDSIQAAFQTLLAPGAGYYTPPKRPDFFTVIGFIKQLGGISVLAHPFLNLTEAQLERLLPVAARCGLDAMETMYSRYDPSVTEKAKALAVRFDLLESGGSDFHGGNKPDIKLGTGTGNLHIPVEVYCGLKRKTE